MSPRTVAVAAGLAAGLLLGFLLPGSWLFSGADRAAHEPGRTGKFACPMFCVVMDEKPADGKCPVCGMQLTEVSGHSTLNAQERGMIGLEVDTFRRRPLARNVRVVGEVDYDETRLARITTRVSGWLERVWIDATWMQVDKDQPLAAIYSPELYAAQREFLVARGELREAARRRLLLFGVSATEVAELEKSGTVQESLLLRAPRAGVVVERRATEGGAVRSGDLLYTVADLSRVWVQAEALERDLVWILTGQPVRLEIEGRGEPIRGTVAFVDPVLDRRTRTARVRIEVDNPAGPDGMPLLRIGQRVDAWIEARVDAAGRPVPQDAVLDAEPLTVPRSAVLRTGERTVVYLLHTEVGERRDYALDPGALPDVVFYEMIEVRLGPPAQAPGGATFYPVLGLARPTPRLSSLEEGMTVVSQGNLLLDSQAQLSGKPSLLFPEGSRGAAPGGHAGH